MKLKLRKRLFTKIPLKLLLLIFLLSIILVVFVTQTDFLTVKKINIEGDNLSCVQNSQIKSNLEFFGKQIFLLNLKKAEEDLKTEYICIKDIKFSQIFPDKLDIRIVKRKAQMQFSPHKFKESSPSTLEMLINTPATQSAQILKQDEGFFVDDSGVIFEKGIGENIFKVYLNQELTLGKKMDESLINNFLKIIEKFKEFGINIDKVYFEKGDLITLEATPKLLFRINNKIDDQLAALHLILEKAKIDDEIIEFIDLRFDKPVVKYGKR